MRIAVGLAAILAWALTGSCAHVTPRLKPADLRACLAEGGYESVAPFGVPFCQLDYADGGKVCQGRSDCIGRCLSDAPENARTIAVGSAVTGRCERHRSTFGCYGAVEDGKLAEAYVCVD